MVRSGEDHVPDLGIRIGTIGTSGKAIGEKKEIGEKEGDTGRMGVLVLGEEILALESGGINVEATTDLTEKTNKGSTYQF